ncbi:hypothetical protein SAMN05880573_102290 [Chryseobacterium sp. RU33C]|nr:hypothetical protein SAMN05880573_102290 [Chryseobacterium sp. RU33C]
MIRLSLTPHFYIILKREAIPAIRSYSSRPPFLEACCGVTASIRARIIIERKVKQYLESFLHHIKINLTGF